MLPSIYAVLVACIGFRISDGQNAFYSNANPFSFGAQGFADALPPNVAQDIISSVPLNDRNDFQIPTDPITSFPQAQYPSFGPSSALSSIYQTNPIINPSPVEKFVSELNSAIFSSNLLSDIFDLSELSPKAFGTVLYDLVVENAGKVAHSNPYLVASVATTPINEGTVTYTSPILLDIYSNTVAKYLFDRGALDLSNASFLAKEYARFLRESADRNLKKETPESKVLTISDGFIDFMNSIDHFNDSALEDQARYFANEVKRVTNKN